jgi:hypothetical protein
MAEKVARAVSPGSIGRIERRIADAVAQMADLGGQDEARFMHAVLCQVGLPRSAVEGRTFERSSGTASLLLEAGRVHDGMKWQEAPLPFGTKPRLVLLHVCSEAIRTGRREVEIEDSSRAFLRALGIDTGGREFKRFRAQMQALAACRMQLAYRTESRVVNVKCDPIRRFEAWIQDDDGQVAMWPGVLELSAEFFDTLSAHAVPLDQRAIRALQGSALALDVYTWMAHRLCRIRKDGGSVVHWASLRGQFGQEYASDKDFKRELLGALRKVGAVYPDARFEQVTGGLRLYPSPPPVKRKGVVVQLPERATAAALPAPRPASPRTSQGPSETSRDGVKRAISADALEKVRSVAPGWDKYYLLETYAGWIERTSMALPNAPDKAFLGWAKRFTKGKPPR